MLFSMIAYCLSIANRLPFPKDCHNINMERAMHSTNKSYECKQFELYEEQKSFSKTHFIAIRLVNVSFPTFLFILTAAGREKNVNVDFYLHRSVVLCFNFSRYPNSQSQFT